MTDLFSNQWFEDNNLDTIERAIIGSALVLRAQAFFSTVGLSPDQITDDIRDLRDSISVRVRRRGTATLFAEVRATLPYDIYQASINGGVSLTAVGEIGETTNVKESDVVFDTSPSEDLPVLENIPYTEIETFERYLLFSCLNLSRQLQENRNSTVLIDIRSGSIEEATINITANLTILESIYLSGRTLIDSVTRLVTTYDDLQLIEEDESNDNGEETITNISELNDDVLLNDTVLLGD